MDSLLNFDIVTSTQDGTDIAKLSDREVCDILTREDQNDSHSSDVVTGAGELKDEKPELKLGSRHSINASLGCVM